MTQIDRFIAAGDALLKKGLSDTEIKEIEAAAMRRLLNDSTPHYPVTVNYDLTLEQMIAAGHYDETESDITVEHFPVTGEGKVDVDIQLVPFNCVIGSDEAIRELDHMDLRPATLPELLAFGAAYPEVQREFTILALGSVWRYRNGYWFVPFLCGYSDGERHLDLDSFEGGWDEDYLFAAVRK